MATRETLTALLLSEGWTQLLVQRALKSYEYYSPINLNYVSNDVVAMIRQIMKLIQSKDGSHHISSKTTKSPPFHATFLSLNRVNQLKVGDTTDFRSPSSNGKFVLGTIVGKAHVLRKEHTKLNIQYESNGTLCTVWCDTGNIGGYRFAKAESISRRPRNRLKDLEHGHYIHINPLFVKKHRGWRVARICGIDACSGQIQVVYNENNTTHLYWVHVDNTSECNVFDGSASHVTYTSNGKRKWIDDMECVCPAKKKQKLSIDSNLNVNSNMNAELRTLKTENAALSMDVNVLNENNKWMLQKWKQQVDGLQNKYKDLSDKHRSMLNKWKTKVNMLQRKHNILKIEHDDERNKCLDEMHQLKRENREMKRSLNLYRGVCLDGMKWESLNDLEEEMESALQNVKQSKERLFEDRVVCIVCYHNEKNIVMDGCNHFVLCKECEKRMKHKRCPKCKAPYKSITELRV